MEILLVLCSCRCCLATISRLTHWLTAKLLLALASTVTLGSESHGTHDHVLLSDGSGSLQTTLPLTDKLLLALASTVIICLNPTGLMTIFYCLLAVGAFRPLCLGQSVKLLLAFASTVIPGFSLLEIHDQDFYSLLDMYVFQNGASSSMKERSVFLCRHYVCCTIVSAQVYPYCHSIQVTVHPLSLHCTK
jgi:hypothetical protein